MVISCRMLCWSVRGRRWKRRPIANRREKPGTSNDSGSGGTMERMGLTKRAISAMAFEYSS